MQTRQSSGLNVENYNHPKESMKYSNLNGDRLSYLEIFLISVLMFEKDFRVLNFSYFRTYVINLYAFFNFRHV